MFSDSILIFKHSFLELFLYLLALYQKGSVQKLCFIVLEMNVIEENKTCTPKCQISVQSSVGLIAVFEL